MFSVSVIASSAPFLVPWEVPRANADRPPVVAQLPSWPPAARSAGAVTTSHLDHEELTAAPGWTLDVAGHGPASVEVVVVTVPADASITTGPEHSAFVTWIGITKS